MNALFSAAIIQMNVKVASHCDQELLEISMGVCTSVCVARHVVQVVNSLDRKRDMAIAFDEGQTASWIPDFRQGDESALVYRHESKPQSYLEK